MPAPLTRVSIRPVWLNTDVGRHLARGLVNLASFWAPEVVIVVVPAALGEDAGLIGAACLTSRNLR
jgi:predicted NBD/HSP70 family sugar kinase